MGPAEQSVATAAKAADVFLDRGVLGASCVFLILLLCVAGWVIRTLYNDNKQCHAVALADRSALIKMGEASNDVQQRSLELLQSLKSLLESRNGGLSDLAHQGEMLLQKVQHGLGNIATSQNALLNLLERLSGDRPARRLPPPQIEDERFS